MTISEMIEELEKIKEEHGDLPVKTWEYDEYSDRYYHVDADYPGYCKDEDEECVVIGQ